MSLSGSHEPRARLHSEAAEPLRVQLVSLLHQPGVWEELASLRPGTGVEEAHPWRLYRQLGARGWLAPHWPVRYGGLSLGWPEAAVIMEELVRHGVPDTAIVNGTYNVGECLLVAGTPAQRHRYLPPLASGNLVATVLLTEPDAGSDLAALETTATPRNGGWTLTGRKVWSAKSHVSELALCAARTSAGYAGISLFLVPLRVPGVRIRGAESRPRAAAQRRPLLREVADGRRWLWRHRLLRTLALAVCVDNLAFTAWTVVLVLMLQHRFDVNGLGAMTACLGVGGIVGGFGIPRLSRRFGMAALLVMAMLGEGLATAVLGLASVWPLAVAMLFAIGGCAIGWNVVSVSLRQSIVPDDLLGRVNSAYRLLAVAGAPVGAAGGGLLARWQGLSAPFLVGALAIVLVAVGIATVVTPRAIEAAQSAAEHH